MAARLDDRVAIITGGAQGLGRAYANRLAAAGAALAIIDIDGELADRTACDISTDNDSAQVLAVSADVAHSGQVAVAVAQVLERFRHVDILVNNAGGALFPTARFDAFDEEQWDRVIDVNLKGSWLCARAVAPVMRSRASGRIINVASTVAFRGYPAGLAPYGAAKSGVVGLTRMLAQELGPDGITVNAVAPGYVPVETAKEVHTARAASALRQQMINEQCLKRSAESLDIASAVAFLASDEAAFITGQVLSVDGGWTLR